MSKRRMFSQSIVESDTFLDMPLSAQALYMHLSMNADDYGFVSPRRIMRMIGANQDDLKLLILKRYVLTFDNDVIVIKHWPVNNTVRKDRSHPTTYDKELKSLTYNEIGAYTELSHMSKVAEEIAQIDTHIRTAVVRKSQGQGSVDVEESTTNGHKITESDNQAATTGQPNDNLLTTEIRLDYIRLDKIRLDKTKKNIQKKPAEKIASADIDAVLANWHERVGLELGDEAKQRRAISSLLKQRGLEKVLQLIAGVELALDDKYAPRISDFVSLNRKQNDLILWGRKKGANNAIAQF